MSDIIAAALEHWTERLDRNQSIREIFRHVRDIPYAVVPELVHPQNYVGILELNKGSCAPKHLLLAEMYQRLGLTVLFVVYPFEWDSGLIPYPPEIRSMAGDMPRGHHMACKVEINGRLVLVDATLDSPLKRLGLRVNAVWNGGSDTDLPIIPCGDEQIYHPSEAALMPAPDVDAGMAAFYEKLNDWLDRARRPAST